MRENETVATARLVVIQLLVPSLLTLMTAMNASWGTCTDPMFFMRFLPLACFIVGSDAGSGGGGDGDDGDGDGGKDKEEI